ncbi:hypothetical protein [Pseudobutyrivibrio sp. UC1225]|uniref:hypothetical protein n=1 Tax=Pseudobutyrivibrio sp. UC1225 TaxID=1798185 RepID=UPI0015A4FC38|nr:hypothetical protein [Pseudobutyrivibrio sp. UC1225]
MVLAMMIGVANMASDHKSFIIGQFDLVSKDVNCLNYVMMENYCHRNNILFYLM